MGTHVRKHHFPATNKILSHHMLNSPISAAYYTLCFFWEHLQEGLDVTTSDFNTYTVFIYHVLIHTITNIWYRSSQRSWPLSLTRSPVGEPWIRKYVYIFVVYRLVSYVLQY